MFVGVWPSSARAWLREAHWKERARIDAAPCPERKAFDTEEWLRERTELLRRGKARSHAVASPSIACLIWFQVESDESRGRFPSSVARHRRPLEVEHHGVLGVQRSEPGAGRRATPFPRTRTPRALPSARSLGVARNLTSIRLNCVVRPPDRRLPLPRRWRRTSSCARSSWRWTASRVISPGRRHPPPPPPRGLPPPRTAGSRRSAEARS